MDWKKLALVLGCLLVLIAVCSYLVLATGSGAISMTVVSPTNGSLQYTEWEESAGFVASMNFSITLNESVNASCYFLYANNGTLFEMTPVNVADNTSYYYQFVHPASGQHGDMQNVTYRCGNVTSLHSWMNTSATANWLFYYLNAVDIDTVVDLGITNSSIYATKPGLNITTGSENATNCTYDFNATGKQSGLMTQATWKQHWSNASGMNNYFNDTAYGVWTNITYNCTDSLGNYTASATTWFQIDTTKPTLWDAAYESPGNLTHGGTEGNGNYLQVHFNISDMHPSSCGLNLTWGDGNEVILFTNNSEYNATPRIHNCSINVSADDITRDGYLEVSPYAKDAAGNNITNTSATQAYVVKRLKEGWNIITGYENKTLTQIAMEFPNVTYVSIFNNHNDHKNFTTFTVGGTTNANIALNHSASNYSYGAAFVYVAEDINIIRRHYPVPVEHRNVTLWANTSSNKTDWNLVGVTSWLSDMNDSVMQDICENTTMTVTNESVNFTANNTWVSLAKPKVVAASAVQNKSLTLSSNWSTNSTHIKVLDESGEINFANGWYANVTYTWATDYPAAYCANLTWLSFYHSQDGKYCSWYQNRLATSCDLKSDDYNLTRADGLWIAVQDIDLTLARGDWT